MAATSERGCGVTAAAAPGNEARLDADDRVRILDLVARADDCATRRDVDGYLALLTDDAVLDGAEGEHRGLDDLREALPRVWAAEPAGTRHLSTTVTIDAGDAWGLATAHASLILVAGRPSVISAIVEVRQELRRVDNEWRIGRRTVIG